MCNICVDIFDILNIIILFINVVVLCVQCVLNKQSIKQTKILSEDSQQKTEMLSKSSRFLKYDNLLNAILYEFYGSRNEILGLENNTQKVINEIKEISENGSSEFIHAQSAILNYNDFLLRFKLSTSFEKIQENGYIFFIKEEYNDTIWENTWNHQTLTSLHQSLGGLINSIKSLDNIVNNEKKKIGEEIKNHLNEETLTRIEKAVNKINSEIIKYKKSFNDCVNQLPETCETYKVYKELNGKTIGDVD